MKWNIDDVPIFVAVVQQQGVSAAADFLGKPKSSVSRAITRLEEALGVRLLERNSRNVRTTSEGDAFFRHCISIMEQVEEANAQMSGLTAVPTGPLVVALPIAFGREIIAKHLAEFEQQYPHIELEIIITSHPVDIIQEQIDLAVTIGPLHDSDLIARQLLSSRLVWVASEAYAKEYIQDEASVNLAQHIKVCEKRYGINRFPIRETEQKSYLDLTRAIHINDPIAVREAVSHGCGVSMIPMMYCKKQLKEGSLVEVFKQIEFEASASSISVVYPGRRLISNKTRAFLDFLQRITANI